MKRKPKKQPAKRQEPNSILLFSYVPLLAGDPTKLHWLAGTKLPDDPFFANYEENAEFSHAAACLWRREADGTPSFVLALERAEAIAKHLATWCVGDLTWFKAYVYTDARGYAIALMPDIERSIARWKTTYLATRAEFPPADAKINIVFAPLRFCSQPSQTFNSLQDSLRALTTISVGLLDTSKCDRNNPQDTKDSDVQELGKLDLVWGDCHDYLKSYLNTMAD